MKFILIPASLLLSLQVANAKIPNSIASIPASLVGEDHSKKPDLAAVEKSLRLTPAELQSIDMEDLKNMHQEQLDQVYASIGSGPIPKPESGATYVDLQGEVLARKQSVQFIEARIAQLLAEKGGIAPIAAKVMSFFCGSSNMVECMAEFVWSGKRFYAPTSDGAVKLRNGVNPIIRGIPTMKDPALIALKEKLKQIRPEYFDDVFVGHMRNPYQGAQDATGHHTGKQRLMLFPAHVFCAQSLFDSRKESIVIDYGNGVKDFSDPKVPIEVDALASKDGFWVRDEIRMIRPGLYLGRAYVDRLFILNFALTNVKMDRKDWSGNKNACWNGNSFQ